ncbi:hypothetical protein F8388_022919 [Cannabis sativa]|uniref:Uncharacterized protein n=1 Tax=Cannabis sativa TaxID=3483 RepID=A0A7J6FEY3_CANSA|nr:hypothetical protein F8388_022919 [Cannabis sativa]
MAQSKREADVGGAFQGRSYGREGAMVYMFLGSIGAGATLGREREGDRRVRVRGTLLVHDILALSPEALKLQGHVCYYLRPSFDKKSSLKSSKVNMAGDDSSFSIVRAFNLRSNLQVKKIWKIQASFIIYCMY